MKGTIEELSDSERELLAKWYDTPTYLAFKKLLVAERNNIATKLVDVNPMDVVAISRHQGRADNCKQLNLTLKRNYKEYVTVKDEKSHSPKTKKS